MCEWKRGVGRSNRGGEGGGGEEEVDRTSKVILSHCDPKRDKTKEGGKKRKGNEWEMEKEEVEKGKYKR